MKDILRKIARNKLRYSIVILLFSISISMITIIGNLEASDVEYSKMVQSKYSLADIVISTDFGLSEEILEDIKRIEHVKDAELNIVLGGFSVMNDTYVTFILYGLYEERKLNKPIVEEDAWKLFEGNVCFMDYRMADKLNLTIGDEVEVFTKNGSIKLKIVSLVDAQWTLSFNIPLRVVLFTPIDTLKSFLNVSTYNMLYVLSDGLVDKNELANRIVNMLEDKGIKVLWKSVLTSTPSVALESISFVFGIFMVPTTILSAVVLAVTLIYEIIRDFRYYGIMKALGFTNRQIILKIYKEALIVFLISIPLAAILSLLITKLSFLLFFGEFVGEIPIVLNLRTFAISILINLIVLLIFTFIPASKVLRIKEAEAIRWGYERYQYKPTRRGESFPTYLLIAYRRLIRSKKKLSLIVIMLIVGSSLSFGLVKTSNSLADKIGKSLDDGVDLTVSFRAPIKEGEMMKIKNISGVEDLDPAILLWIHRKNITISCDIYNGNPPSVASSYYVLFFLKRDRKVFSPDIIEGRLPLNANEIALLPKIALFLGIKVGDEMEIKIDSLNISIKAKVVGIVNEMYQNELGFIFLDEVMYNAGAINKGYYNAAFIKLKEDANIDEVIKGLMDFSELNIASIWIMKDLRKMINELVVKSIVVFLTAISTMVITMSIIGMGLFFFMSYVSRLKRDISFYQSWSK